MIYFDANATAALRPEARIAIEQTLENSLGNPSSVHAAGRQQRGAIRRARDQILTLAGLTRREATVVFTSGGTESCQLIVDAFLGSIEAKVRYPGSIVVSTIEHAAMGEGICRLSSAGWKVNRVGCNAQGQVCPEEFTGMVTPGTALVSLMAANNETGSIQPVCEVAQLLRSTGYAGPIVCDMIQAIVKSELTVAMLFAAGIDAVAISAHKIGAPAGVGAAIFSKASQRCFQLMPSLVGGPQEDRLRAGSENLLGIVAFGAVAASLAEEQVRYRSRLAALREQLWSQLAKRIARLHRITPLAPNHAICNTLSLAVEDCRADDLVVSLDLLGIAASTGAACSSGKQSRSHVIEALQIPEALKDSVIRLSLDWNSTTDEIARAVPLIAQAVDQMRSVDTGVAVNAHA